MGASRKINRDHAKKTQRPMMEDKAIAEQIEALLTPAITAQENYCRQLGLSYLWTGSINGIKLQIWVTWLFYAVLVDLSDAIADELSLSFDSISLEMIYRGMYHFYVAHQKGKAADPVKYFAAPENRDLGIVKKQRKPNVKLIVAPFPEKQRGSDQFFFRTSSETPLTTAIQP
jgi:hypothetical protein